MPRKSDLGAKRGIESKWHINNVFKQIDIDADNALSRDEISSYLKQQVETMQNAGGEQGEEARKMMEDQDKLVEEIFAHEDKD